MSGKQTASLRHRSASLVAALVCLRIATAVGGEEWISHISPDGLFAVQRYGKDYGSEDAALIALPSGATVRPLENWAGDLVWTLDSRRFAHTHELGMKWTGTAIYERVGDRFDVVEVIQDYPGSRSVFQRWPRGWREGRYGLLRIHPKRWLTPDALLLDVSHAVQLDKKAESQEWSLEGRFTVTFGKKGKRSKSALTTSSRGFGDAKPSPPKLVSDHLAEPDNWQMSPDKSVALIESAGVLDLIKQRRDGPARVTHLGKLIEQLLLSDFNASGAAPLNVEKPFSFDGDGFLEGAERVVIRGEATTNPDGKQRSKMWCARLDAVWSLEGAKFIEQKIVRGFCGKLGEGESVMRRERSPSGTFRIELREELDANQRATGEYKAFVVPEKADAGEEAALPKSIRSGDASSLTCHISPDERSIYAEWGAGGERRCSVFARAEGFRFLSAVTGPVHGEDIFDQAMWDFCRKTASVEPTSRRKCAFVAWAPDSSRVLIALDVDIKGLMRDWKVYWNARTRTFELTPFLTQLNDRAYEISGNVTFEPFCAEPVGPLPPIDELDRQVAAAREEFQVNWTGTAAHEKLRIEKEAPGTWPKIEKKADTWRTEGIAGIEKAALEFSRRWPKAEREQWRRLSLAGGYRALSNRIGSEWPWIE